MKYKPVSIGEVLASSNPDIGAIADAAVTDPDASASMIAAIKGLLKQLQGDGSGAVPINDTRAWDSAVTLAATDGYSGAVADLAADEAYDYTDSIDLSADAYERIAITLEFDSSGTTDNIIFSLFGSLDGTDFDDNPVWSVELDATSGADTQESFSFPNINYPYIKFGVKTSGTTDTFDYRIKYAKKA